MNGFINIDKPQNISSFDVIRRLKKILPKKTRLGHLGTLDPLATGVLPVALGYATRVISYISRDTKEYIAEMQIGAVSDTEDIQGNITYTENRDFEVSRLIDILESMQGTIQQIPPMYSALHHQGKRLYELARQGIEVERTAREVEINSIKLLSVDKDKELPIVTISVDCSRGTYIRSLCRDIGQKLGTGAVMSRLVRTRSGLFTIQTACSLDYINQYCNDPGKWLHPVDYPLKNLKEYYIDTQDELKWVINGNKLAVDINKSGWIKIYYGDRHLVAIGETIPTNDRAYIQPRKVLIRDVEEIK